jgi:hypothetical protein
LAIIMPAPEYLTRPGAEAFDLPIHPGASPPTGGTSIAAITEVNRKYLADI